ncbi:MULTISPECIES: VanZ family protein [Anoxybacillus]|uniref:VanZ family protein n=1 Tax=Anoxybacillus TaxID=150247 RepID=UPI000385A844|nr:MULTISPECIES: VanZ family protein [Anoxybacillus]EPZ38750.1 VanZ like family protein [Anoxybacillus ayderensis]KHF29324.1 VanZ like family protein [Anoxybacillus sp. BCO1]NNU96442.1 VanZ family protein [Anoxybacillus sp. EFIL]
MTKTNRLIWWGLVFIWCMLIYYFTESPLFTGEQTAQWIRHWLNYFGIETNRPVSDGVFSWNFIVRKCAHMTVFGTLAFLVWKATHPHRYRYRIAWIFTLIYAIFDEWHQSFQPKRTALFSDVIIDMVGATIVLWIVWKANKRA